jgi:hypothetical protein
LLEEYKNQVTLMAAFFPGKWHIAGQQHREGVCAAYSEGL